MIRRLIASLLDRITYAAPISYGLRQWTRARRDIPEHEPDIVA